MPAPDPIKSPRLQLVEAVNRLYRRRIPVEGVVFGPVTLIDDSVNDISNPTQRNSSVEISSAEGEPYEFTTVLHFNRLSLEALFVGRDTSFGGSLTHSHDLVPMLASRLGLPLTVEDIVGHEIDDAVGYPKTLLLVAAETSLLLYGQINITLAGP